MPAQPALNQNALEPTVRDGTASPSVQTGSQRPIFGASEAREKGAHASSFGRAETRPRGAGANPGQSRHGVIRIEVRAGELPSEELLREKDMFPATPFQNPAWMRAWQEKIGDAQGIMPVTVVGYVGPVPVFILPLAVKRKFGTRMLTWHGYHLNDYCGPIISDSYMLAASSIDSERVLADIAQQVGGIDIVYLTKTPAKLAGLSNPFIIGGGMPYHARAHAIGLTAAASFDSFYAGRRSAKTRRRIKDKLNALEKLGPLEFRFASEVSEARKVSELCLAAKSRQLHESGHWDPFSDPAAREFIVASFADHVGKTTWACSLNQGSEVLATAVGFCGPRSWLLYQMSMEDTGKERHSPGTHLLLNILRRCIEEGAEELDLALGDEGYKAEWCDTDKDLMISSLAVSAKGHVMEFALKVRDRLIARSAADPKLYRIAKRLQHAAKSLRLPV